MRAAIIILALCAPVTLADELTATTHPNTQPIDRVPPVVMLDDLVALYQPVPFDHRSHAKMSEMWDGCETCHHRKPNPATRPSDLPSTRTQSDAAKIPRCRECHRPAAQEANLKMPSLKGAYHRQCLNCHREWTGANQCVVCHAERNPQLAATAPTTLPTTDDIVGRMHPPIEEPKDTFFRARFAPVAGSNVLFRHQEHSKRFGIHCVTCHRRDNCADCHAPDAAAAPISKRSRPLNPGSTWRQTHSTCLGCHENDHCNHCHYPDDASPPAAFEHANVGQLMDKDHATLECKECHQTLKAAPTCGDSSCHHTRAVAFPTDRPGPVRKTKSPATTQVVVATHRSATGPATRPTVIRIRRGGL